MKTTNKSAWVAYEQHHCIQCWDAQLRSVGFILNIRSMVV